MGPMVARPMPYAWPSGSKRLALAVLACSPAASVAKRLSQPAIVADLKPSMKLSCEELFGPAVGASRVESIDEAIALANGTRYGLTAAVFTQNIDWASSLAKWKAATSTSIGAPRRRADLNARTAA